jgi:hypothetical protein
MLLHFHHDSVSKASFVGIKCTAAEFIELLNVKIWFLLAISYVCLDPPQNMARN